jgi:hypothetical protein
MAGRGGRSFEMMSDNLDTQYLCITNEILKILPRNRPWGPIGLRNVDPTLPRQSAYRERYGCQPYAPAVLWHCAGSRKVAGSRPDTMNDFYQFT